MWRIKTPPGEKRKEVKKAQFEEKVPLKVSFYKERESTKWGHKRKKRVRASQLWQLSMGSELWWAVTAEKSRRGELFAGWDLHPVEFKPAGEVLNQTSQHLKIHISISKRPFDKVRSDLSPCSSYDSISFFLWTWYSDISVKNKWSWEKCSVLNLWLPCGVVNWKSFFKFQFGLWIWTVFK